MPKRVFEAKTLPNRKLQCSILFKVIKPSLMCCRDLAHPVRKLAEVHASPHVITIHAEDQGTRGFHFLLPACDPLPPKPLAPQVLHQTRKSESSLSRQLHQFCCRRLALPSHRAGSFSCTNSQNSRKHRRSPLQIVGSHEDTVLLGGSSFYYPARDI